MFKLQILMVGTLLLPVNAYAQTGDEIVAGFNSINPVSALVKRYQGCTLIRPLYAQSNGANQINEGSLGNVAKPLSLLNSTIYDIGAGNFCRVTTFKPPLVDATKTLPFEFGVKYRADASATINAKLGSWLTLAEFTAKDLSTTSIGFQGDTLTYDDEDLANAVIDIKKNAKFCPAMKMPKASVISRNCVGYLYVGLETTKEISLNALEFKFATLTVGLNVDWIRQINGTLENCAPKAPVTDASKDPKKANAPATDAKATNAPKTDAKKADAPAKDTKATDAAGKTDAATPTANKNGFSVDIKTKLGSVKVDPSSVTLTLPSGIQDQAPTATDKQKPTTASTSPTQPEAGNSSCVKSVLYRTAVPVIYGVALKDAAPFKAFANEHQ